MLPLSESTGAHHNPAGYEIRPGSVWFLSSSRALGCRHYARPHGRECLWFCTNLTKALLSPLRDLSALFLSEALQNPSRLGDITLNGFSHGNDRCSGRAQQTNVQSSALRDFCCRCGIRPLLCNFFQSSRVIASGFMSAISSRIFRSSLKMLIKNTYTASLPRYTNGPYA